MPYTLYSAALALLAPAAKTYLAFHPTHRLLLGRFYPGSDLVAGSHIAPVCVHACSVGEVAIAARLLDFAATRFPELPHLVTTSTRTGLQQAQKALPCTPRDWLPFDTRSAVRRFYEAHRPRALILLETELWPNLIIRARDFKVPVLIFNGRLSDKHFDTYMRYRRFFAPALGALAAVAAQDDDHAARFAQLGIPVSRIHVLGTMKFDGVCMERDETKIQRILRENRLNPEAPIILFGSTRPGDEPLAAASFDLVRAKHPTAQLIIAPRHPERIEEAMEPFGGRVRRRSRIQTGAYQPESNVLFLDTLGELNDFYHVATVAVIGGSMIAGVNGHNPIEPAALGIPTVFGRHMRNFEAPAAALLKAGGAVKVENPDKLGETLIRLLSDSKLRNRIGAAGQDTIRSNQGATERHLDLLARFLSTP